MNKVVLDSILRDASPVFLASCGPEGSGLTLHVAVGCDIAGLKARVDTVLTQAGEALSVSVRKHDLRKLAFPRSLEHWLRSFASAPVIFDPTMIAGRARALVEAAKACRENFGNSIVGVFFDPKSRRMFVVVRPRELAHNVELQMKIRGIVTKAQDLAAADSDNVTDWRVSVQLVPALPNRRMVPVDARSSGLFGRVARFINRWRTPGALAVAISTVAAMPAAARTDPTQWNREDTRSVVSTQVEGSYGFLSALSVFTDGQRLDDANISAAAGLKYYFGDDQVAQLHPEKMILLAGPLGS